MGSPVRKRARRLGYSFPYGESPFPNRVCFHFLGINIYHYHPFWRGCIIGPPFDKYFRSALSPALLSCASRQESVVGIMVDKKRKSKPPPPPPRREKSRPKATSDDDNGTRGKSGPREKGSSRSKSKTGHSSNPPGTSKKKQQPKKPQDDSKSRSNKNATRSSSRKRPSANKRNNFAQNARKAIPASIRMISGCRDSQTSADVSKISSQFQLPNPAGRSGGACTAALLEVLYQSHERGRDGVSWVDVLRQMRDVLEGRGFEQVPQLTSSRMIDVHDPFVITPTGGSFKHKSNTKRALLIGINYTGQKGQLSGCHNDVHNVAKYLMEEEGFRKENVTILMDDGKHKSPTKSNMLTAYKRLVRECREGDVVFCHYSGHGGRLADDGDDEEDGYDETLIPVVSLSIWSRRIGLSSNTRALAYLSLQLI